MRAKVTTTKRMTVKASDGYDCISLSGGDAYFTRSRESIPAVFFEHYRGRNYQGSLILDLDNAEAFAADILRFVEFQRHEVEG